MRSTVMRIEDLFIAGYRSVRSLRMTTRNLEVLVGANGCGKTNVYRAIQLLAHAASGTLAHALVEEGGMPSVLWAGARAKAPVRVKLEVDLSGLRYAIEFGIVPPTSGSDRDEPSMFNFDPDVKVETVQVPEGRKRIVLMERKGPTVWARDVDGVRLTFPFALWSSESVLPQITEPHRLPILSDLRQQLLRWRFYHSFRTDADAPARHPQIGVRTPALAHDGADLAAALQTIAEIGDRGALDDGVSHAFPGSRLSIDGSDGRFLVLMTMPGVQRALRASELSDGTLRYLSLLAALLSPRPAPFLALNEPETSIHPDLLAPLARLIVEASKQSQMLVTTHSEGLARHIGELGGSTPVRLVKVKGETRIGDEDEQEDGMERDSDGVEEDDE